MESETSSINTKNFRFLYYNNEISTKPSEKNLPAYGNPINRGKNQVEISVLTVGGQKVSFTLGQNEWSPVRVKKFYACDDPEADIRILV